SVRAIPTPGELVVLPEQPWGSPRQRAQSFQIAGACGLHVPKAARPTTECAVDGQLVRARVQAQFVRPETAGDPRVQGAVGLKGGGIADVVRPLLEAAHEARCQADPLEASLASSVAT